MTKIFEKQKLLTLLLVFQENPVLLYEGTDENSQNITITRWSWIVCSSNTMLEKIKK